jgi:hypothetical protein
MGEPVQSFGQAVRDGVKVHQRCQLKISISDIQSAILTPFTGQTKLVSFSVGGRLDTVPELQPGNKTSGCINKGQTSNRILLVRNDSYIN